MALNEKCINYIIKISNFSVNKISDIKSVFGRVGVGSTFSADIIPYTQYNVGLSTISTPKYFRNINYVQTSIIDTVPSGSLV